MQLWITPPFDGPVTGGTLYNAHMLAELARAGVTVQQQSASAPIARGAASSVWVDSLYLAELPRIRGRIGATPLWLVLHYLPSLCSSDPEAKQEHERIERAALATADRALVTGGFLRDQVAALYGRDKAVRCVEPGVAAGPTASPTVATPPAAVVLGRVAPEKGIAELLSALLERGAEDRAFTLRIVGALDAAPAYAARCERLLAEHPALARRVRLMGELPPPAARRTLSSADVLLSASPIESYGMALSEARAAGVPILARRGGHTAAHVRPDAGGELLDDCDALAQRLMWLVRRPELLARRKRAALQHRHARSWAQAARELIAHTS